MFLLRVLAGTCLLFATIALVADFTRSTGGITPGSVVSGFTSLMSHWKALTPDLLKGFQDMIVSVHPALWTMVVARLLSMPTWLGLGALGLMLGYLGRKQRRANIFINN